MAGILACCPPTVQRLVALAALGVALTLTGCGGRREAFIGARVEEQCNAPVPVCDQVVGCLIGTRSYVEGRLPGTGRFSLILAEPSDVKVQVFLDEVQAAGDETALTLHEDRCRSRVREAVDGRVFVGEAEELGMFSRTVELFGVGEHLLELQSDAQAQYVLKVDVVPKRGP